MRYLCPHHLKNIAADPVMAMTLWRDAMDGGVSARERRDWLAARNFFGAAYETAILHYQHIEPDDSVNNFSLLHLIDASQQLSDVLQHLQLWEEAQICLLTIQHGLLRDCISPDNGDTNKAPQVLIKTQEIIDGMLNLCGDELAADTPANTGFANADKLAGRYSGKPDMNSMMPTIDILLSSTFYLITRYVLNPSRELNKAIAEHFERIYRHADCLSPTLNKTCQRLSLQWHDLLRKKNKNYTPTKVHTTPQIH